MNVLQMSCLGLTGINIVLAAVVALVYFRNHHGLRSPFTLGFAVFGAAALVYNVVLGAYTLTMMPMFTLAADLFLLSAGALQAVALGGLAYATMR